MRLPRALLLVAGATLFAACDGDGNGDPNGPSNAAPSAAFTVHCRLLECTFRNGSADSDGSIRDYRWDFGDNSLTMTTRDAAHTFAAPGEFTVTLTVNDDDGKRAVATEQVTVGDPPTAAFTADCATLVCTFRDESSTTRGVLVAWFWDFGDGQTSRAPDPNHIYFATQPTEFTVTLTVTDDDSETATVAKQVSVTGRPPHDPPTAAFTVTCSAVVCTFKDESTSTQDIVSAWFWNFGDGQTSHAQNPTHVYDVSEPTRFTVTLLVSDSDLAFGFASQEILVTPDG